MVIDFFRQMMTLYMVMVIIFFRYRPSPQDWSNLFFFKKSKYKKTLVFRIGTLYMVMVVKSFRYSHSPRDWYFYIWKSKKKDLSNWDPLLGNGHLVPFRCRPSPFEWSSLSSNLSSFETWTKLVSLSLLIFYYDNMKKNQILEKRGNCQHPIPSG